MPSPYLENTPTRAPGQVGTLILTTYYHRVRRDDAGGYAIYRKPCGSGRYIPPGDDAAQFADELWTLEERSDLPPCATDRFLSEYFA